ncbi:hypothetical protein BS17DRAFT_765187 [Gyrodon lividus]|nr:hypothetical protein BS17DRAFT_765187 [Gyrodon lividus]
MPVCHSKCVNASNNGAQTEEDCLGKANAVKPSNKSTVSKSLKPSSKSRSATSKSSLKVVPSRCAKTKHRYIKSMHLQLLWRKCPQFEELLRSLSKSKMMQQAMTRTVKRLPAHWVHMWLCQFPKTGVPAVPPRDGEQSIAQEAGADSQQVRPTPTELESRTGHYKKRLWHDQRTNTVMQYPKALETPLNLMTSEESQPEDNDEGDPPTTGIEEPLEEGILSSKTTSCSCKKPVNYRDRGMDDGNNEEVHKACERKKQEQEGTFDPDDPDSPSDGSESSPRCIAPVSSSKEKGLKDLGGKELTCQLMACRDALTLGAQNWSQVGSIEVIGLVLYLENDEVCQQASGFFAGSKVLANLLDEKQTDVKSLINYLTVAIILARVKMAEPKAKISVPVFDVGRNCQVLPDIMAEKCTTIGIPHDGQNFKWKNLLDNLVKYQCYILDYPSGVHPFGPGFDYHNLSVLHMNALVVPYLKHIMGSHFSNGTVNLKSKTIKGKEHEHVDIPDTEFTIKLWPEEYKCWAEKDQQQLDIPLVVSTDESILRMVLDSPGFLKTLPKDATAPPCDQQAAQKAESQ